MNPQEVRERSLSWLRERGFLAASWLPLPESSLELRPAAEIATRLMALDGLFAFVVAPDNAVSDTRLARFFEQDDLAAHLSASERDILIQERRLMRSVCQSTIGWKLENMWPLAWALGFGQAPTVEASFITDEVTQAIMRDFLPSFDADLPGFCARLSPRAPDEVGALEDLFYCAHNAVRSAQMGGATVPEGFHPVMHGGVIHERRHALTWCLSPGAAWDETDLST